MFGKNYDEELNKLRADMLKAYEEILANRKHLEIVNVDINKINEHLVNIAKTNIQHNKVINFLLNNVEIKVDAKEDFLKLLQDL